MPQHNHKIVLDNCLSIGIITPLITQGMIMEDNDNLAHLPLNRVKPCVEELYLMKIKSGLSNKELAEKLGISEEEVFSLLVHGETISLWRDHETEE